MSAAKAEPTIIAVRAIVARSLDFIPRGKPSLTAWPIRQKLKPDGLRCRKTTVLAGGGIRGDTSMPCLARDA
jgi:hypothetical protein